MQKLSVCLELGVKRTTGARTLRVEEAATAEATSSRQQALI
ncbi:hypothetical protein ACP70R_011474 [Stipagrostis hirtigluma subsp. patula]